MIYMVVPVLLATLAGFLRGGRLRNLVHASVQQAWIPLVMFALQFGIVLFPQGRGELLLALRPWVMIATYALLLAFLWANRRLPGMKLILLGAALNLAVILSNGGYMPVTREALARSGHLDLVVRHGGQEFVLGSKDIVLPAAQTRLQWLSDILGIPQGLPVSATFSAGDLVIMMGTAGLVYGLMLAGGPRRRNANSKLGTDPIQPMVRPG